MAVAITSTGPTVAANGRHLTKHLGLEQLETEAMQFPKATGWANSDDDQLAIEAARDMGADCAELARD